MKMDMDHGNEVTPTTTSAPDSVFGEENSELEQIPNTQY